MCRLNRTLLGFMFSLVSAPLLAVTATTTTLAISPGGGVEVGTVVTLTATVKITSSQTLATGNGTVNFCNANNFPGTSTPIKCVAGSGLYGTAQLTSAGTASIKMRFGTGTYNIQAVFRGNTADAGSTSTTNTLTVANSVSTLLTSSTTLTEQAGGSSGVYTLGGAVTSFGSPAPTGSITLTDTSDIPNASLGTATSGSATFTLPAVTSVTTGGTTGGETPAFMGVGDFNGDGIPDIAVANISGTPNVSIFLGNANGGVGATPSSTLTLPGSGTPAHIVVGDFNNDGIPDLAISSGSVTAPATSNGIVTIFLGSSSSPGTFMQVTNTLTTGINPLGIAVGDFNLDGNLDLAVVNNVAASTVTDTTVNIFLGTGAGTFTIPTVPSYCLGTGTSCTTTTSPTGIAAAGTRFLTIGDFNNDGNLDLATSNNSTANISILLGSANGTFTLQNVLSDGPGISTSTTNANPNAIVTADFNGDGVLDLAVAIADNGLGSTANVLLGSTVTPGTFGAAATYATGGFGPQGLAVGDF